jgi:hypothetical protein
VVGGNMSRNFKGECSYYACEMYEKEVELIYEEGLFVGSTSLMLMETWYCPHCGEVDGTGDIILEIDLEPNEGFCMECKKSIKGNYKITLEDYKLKSTCNECNGRVVVLDHGDLNINLYQLKAYEPVGGEFDWVNWKVKEDDDE